MLKLLLKKISNILVNHSQHVAAAITLSLVLYAYYTFSSLQAISKLVDANRTFQTEYEVTSEVYQLSEQATFWMLHYSSTSSIESKRTAEQLIKQIQDKTQGLNRSKDEFLKINNNLQIIYAQFIKAHDMSVSGFELVSTGITGQAVNRIREIRGTLNTLKTNAAEGLAFSADKVQEANEDRAPITIGLALVVIISMILNITLRINNQRLQRSLADLSNAQDQLIEKEYMASLGGLVAGVAHEINTPLGVSITSVSHVENQLKKVDEQLSAGSLSEPQYKKLYQDIHEGLLLTVNNLNRAAELVNSFKKVAVDQSSQDHRRFKVQQYLHDIVASLKPVIKGVNTHIDLKIDDDIEICSCPSAFYQIFSNLIINSYLHGFEEMEDGQITIYGTKEGDQFQIDYQDNGKGISPSIKDHIFEPFTTTKRHSGGSGLGTNIIYNQITQVLGGTIELIDGEKQGAHFKISIPWAKVASA